MSRGHGLDGGCWSKLCEQGHLSEVVGRLGLLVQQGLYVPAVLFHRVLTRCIAHKHVDHGTGVHALAVDNGYEASMHLASHVIRMYASHGRLQAAVQVFTTLGPADALVWNSMILAHAQHRQPEHAIKLYKEMMEADMKPSVYVLVAVLKACACVADVVSGREVHAHVLRSGVEPNVILGNCLVDMYAKCGSLNDARRVFDTWPVRDVVTWTAMVSGYAKSGSLEAARRLFDAMPARNVVTWTAMITGYANHGLGEEALDLYARMQQEGATVPDDFTFACLLKACASARALHLGKQIHSQIRNRGFQSDIILTSSLVDMYAKCGSLEDAQRVFDSLTTKDVVSWNAMLAGYAQHGLGQESLQLYARMQQEGITSANHVTFTLLLNACASIGAQQHGRKLHCQVWERGLQDAVMVGNSLVDMYAKCSRLDEARRVFEGMPTRDIGTWNAMLAGYAQNGLGHEVLRLYTRMLQEGMVDQANHVTFLCLLKACASVGALHEGKELHSLIKERGLEGDPGVGNCLVDMYAKCGSLQEACSMFSNMHSRDVVAWNSMLAGYAQHGLAQEALECYDKMKIAGIKPDEVTFLGLLSACSHAGLVDKGVAHFDSMSRDHGIAPQIDHYCRLVDLFARAGCFRWVEELVAKMPMEPDLAIWLCVLAACRNHGNLELGEEAFSRAVQLQPKHSAAYVLMSHIYADAGFLDLAVEVHSMRQSRLAWKRPGQSWVELEQQAHSFVVGGGQYSEHGELFALLGEVSLRLEEEITQQGRCHEG